MYRLAILTTFLLVIQVRDSISSGADSIANSAASEAEVVAPEHTAHVQRRYVPRFIGKRKAAEGPKADSLLDDKQHSAVEEFLGELKNSPNDQYDNIVDAPRDDVSETDNDFEINYDGPELFSEDELEGYDGDDDTDVSEEVDRRDAPNFVGKRYTPSFVGKRYTPSFVGKRYTPSFVGKRYQPTFIGKRYTPSFVGKRYTPSFVGKRYTPSFVGKRYTPSFVGKRYTPSFVGKRYTPSFVGKRYTPSFVGKRYTPSFVGKRYTPSFVGKRYTPSFVGKRHVPSYIGKRYKPQFVGKRSPVPSFVGKKSSDAPYFVGKRSTEYADGSFDPLHMEKREATVEAQGSAKSTSEEGSGRHKRSVFNDVEQDPDSELKRAWGRYVPWKTISVFQAAPEKRFVAPEFIGRREDSISNLLTALKVLRFANQPPRLANKRFEAPLFIGKRDSPDQREFVMDAYRVVPNSQSSMSSYLQGFPAGR